MSSAAAGVPCSVCSGGGNYHPGNQYGQLFYDGPVFPCCWKAATPTSMSIGGGCTACCKCGAGFGHIPHMNVSGHSHYTLAPPYDEAAELWCMITVRCKQARLPNGEWLSVDAMYFLLPTQAARDKHQSAAQNTPRRLLLASYGLTEEEVETRLQQVATQRLVRMREKQLVHLVPGETWGSSSSSASGSSASSSTSSSPPPSSTPSAAERQELKAAGQNAVQAYVSARAATVDRWTRSFLTIYCAASADAASAALRAFESTASLQERVIMQALTARVSAESRGDISKIRDRSFVEKIAAKIV